ncbi:hypothetical protein VNI00_016984 [Paramarasmius palmivorus]|uniref:C2H2-type domain-containing protein n=1 Tax=Paramarasmius palmivorus TaxID=297713 RepID=A0AAW0B993_9AGAR
MPLLQVQAEPNNISTCYKCHLSFNRPLSSIYFHLITTHLDNIQTHMAVKLATFPKFGSNNNLNIYRSDTGFKDRDHSITAIHTTHAERDDHEANEGYNAADINEDDRGHKEDDEGG